MLKRNNCVGWSNDRVHNGTNMFDTYYTIFYSYWTLIYKIWKFFGFMFQFSLPCLLTGKSFYLTRWKTNFISEAAGNAWITTNRIGRHAQRDETKGNLQLFLLVSLMPVSCYNCFFPVPKYCFKSFDHIRLNLVYI